MRKSMVISVLIIIVSISLDLGFAGGELYAQENVTYLPDGYEGVLYTHRLKAPEGFIKPLEWKIISAGPPGWLNLSPSGQITGIPELSENGAGEKRPAEEYRIQVEVSGKKEVEKIIDENNRVLIAHEEYKEYLTVFLKIKRYPLWCTGETFRVLLGLEQSGASSAIPQQRIMLDIYLGNALPFLRKKESQSSLGDRLTAWGNIKFTSLPQQIGNPLVKAPLEFEKIIKNLNLNEVVQGVEFLAGLDWRIWEIPRNRPPEYHDRWYAFSLVGAYGAITPISSIHSIQIYELTDKAKNSLIERYKDCSLFIADELEGKSKVAFIKTDKKKFFRQWYLGFRIKSYRKPEFDKEKQSFAHQFPATFEVSLGGNEAIVARDTSDKTDCEGQRKKLAVLRIGGFMPFKISKIVTVYLFGTAMLHFNREKRALPIIMKPAPADTAFPDPENIAEISYPDERRDFYKIGVGIEFTQIIDKLFSAGFNKKET